MYRKAWNFITRAEVIWSLILNCIFSIPKLITDTIMNIEVDTLNVIQAAGFLALTILGLRYVFSLKERISRIELTNDIQQIMIELRSKSVMRLNRLQEKDYDKGQYVTQEQMKKDNQAIMAVLRSKYPNLSVTQCDEIIGEFLNHKIYE